MTQARDLADGKFDTSTLVVDAANNRVGVGVASPNNPLEIAHTGDAGAGGLRIGDPDTIASDTGIYLRTTGDAVIGAAGGDIVFDTNMAVQERFRITDNGVTFNGDTAAANALNDYEEGTFTPTLSSSFYAGTLTINGYYTKIGNLVYVTVGLKASTSISLTSSGSSYIGGLPFTPDVSQTNKFYVATWANAHFGTHIGTGLLAYSNMYSGQTISQGANAPLVVSGTYLVA